MNAAAESTWRPRPPPPLTTWSREAAPTSDLATGVKIKAATAPTNTEMKATVKMELEAGAASAATAMEEGEDRPTFTKKPLACAPSSLPTRNRITPLAKTLRQSPPPLPPKFSRKRPSLPPMTMAWNKEAAVKARGESFRR